MASWRAPGLPPRTSPSTRARDTVLTAASAAAKTLPSNTSPTAITSIAAGFAISEGLPGAQARSGYAPRLSLGGAVEAGRVEEAVVDGALRVPAPGVGRGGVEVVEDPLLQPEHLAFLAGLRV